MTKPNLSALAHAEKYADSFCVADQELRRYIVRSFADGFDRGAQTYKAAIEYQNKRIKDLTSEIKKVKKEYRRIKYGMHKDSVHSKKEEEW